MKKRRNGITEQRNKIDPSGFPCSVRTVRFWPSRKVSPFLHIFGPHLWKRLMNQSACNVPLNLLSNGPTNCLTNQAVICHLKWSTFDIIGTVGSKYFDAENISGDIWNQQNT